MNWMLIARLKSWHKTLNVNKTYNPTIMKIKDSRDS